MGESPWTFAGAGGRHGDTVNLVEGTSFVVCGRSGIIGEGIAHGLFLLDTRVLTLWRIDVDGWGFEPLAFVPGGPFSGTFVSRVEQAGQPDSPIAIIQRRHVGRGMREDLELRNHGPACTLTVHLALATDLAGLFDVKAGHASGRTDLMTEARPDGICIHGPHLVGSPVDGIVVHSSIPPTAVDPDAGRLTWRIDIAAGATWRTCLDVCATAAGHELAPSHRCGQAITEAVPVGRLARWRQTTPALVSESALLDRVVVQAVDDLGALRIFDPEHLDRVVVAAGAPWFMALFGRDSLLASWMALPFDQQLAAGVLAELADKQGANVDLRTDEQPGRILHEVRFDRLSTQLLGGANTYFGTIDATPLFVMLTAELARWTGVTDGVRALMPAVDRAMRWIDDWGDRDGDGFVEYVRSDDSGLEHQGWKDSWDGIRHADGSVAVPPIALCEVQGYVYAAHRARAALASWLGEDPTVVERHEGRALDLRRRFEAEYWIGERGWYAVGLDGDRRRIGSLTSNIGHLLWTGIVPDHRAHAIVHRLLSPALFTGWGVRTLAADNPGYNPLSYHCGSVWPHDSALAVAGMSRYGFDAEVRVLARALLDAAAASDGRLPELFGGFDRDDVAAPVPYPASCSPQAWASAAPLLLLRSMLGLDPSVPDRRLRIRPRLSSEVGRLVLTGVPIGDELVDIEAEGEMAIVTGTRLEVTVA